MAGATQSIWYFLNPMRIVGMVWRYRQLILQFSKRNIYVRYRGSYLGLLWSFIMPLLMLSIYTFVFGVVFRSRWPGSQSESLLEFALVMFCGISVFNVFGECASQSCSLIVGNPNYVKKVIFPLEILPVATLAAAAFNGLISLLILVIANLLSTGGINWTVVLVPLAALPVTAWTLGVSWILASLGVFFRDLQQIITLCVTALFFLTPIFYSIEAVPVPFQTFMKLNPLGYFVEMFRQIVLWGVIPAPGLYLLHLVLCGVLMTAGYAFFMRTKRGFADVI